VAGPGARGDRSDSPEGEILLAREHEKVVVLVLAGLSYRQVSYMTGYSVRHVGRIVLAERARQFDKRPFAELRAMIWAYLEELHEAMRPAITGEPLAPGASVPNSKDVASMLAIIDRQIRLIGADAPRRSVWDSTADQWGDDGGSNDQGEAAVARIERMIEFSRALGFDRQPPRPLEEGEVLVPTWRNALDYPDDDALFASMWRKPIRRSSHPS
jgi:hypothetical protein